MPYLRRPRRWHEVCAFIPCRTKAASELNKIGNLFEVNQGLVGATCNLYSGKERTHAKIIALVAAL
jgi:hypothetical protein